jgi:Protein of unknown function (DUF982)
MYGEEKMIDKRFESPVFVRNGELIQEIAHIEDALYFLDDWPEKRRGPIYETARRACHAAFDGRYPMDAAREAFAGWARLARIIKIGSTSNEVSPSKKGHHSVSATTLRD